MCIFVFAVCVQGHPISTPKEAFNMEVQAHSYAEAFISIEDRCAILGWTLVKANLRQIKDQ